MIAHKNLVMTLVAGIALTAPWIGAKHRLIGHWDGEIQEIGPGPEIGSGQQIHVLFGYEPNPVSSSGLFTLSAIVDIPQKGIRSAEAKQVRFKQPNVYFELPAGAGTLGVFEGELRSRPLSLRSDQQEHPDEISGTCTIDNTFKTFTLRRRMRK